MSGPLDGVRVGPWYTDEETGYRCRNYVESGSDAAMVYQGVCRSVGQYLWLIVTATPPFVRGAQALTVQYAEDAADACLRKLGATLPGDAVADTAPELAAALAEINRLREANVRLARVVNEDRKAHNATVARLITELEHMTTARDGAADYGDDVAREASAALATARGERDAARAECLRLNSKLTAARAAVRLLGGL